MQRCQGGQGSCGPDASHVTAALSSGFLWRPHREVWSSERFRGEQATGLTNTNVKGVNQQRLRGKEEASGDNSLAAAIKNKRGQRLQESRGTRRLPAHPQWPNNQASSASQSKCHPSVNRNKSGQRGGKVTCAQSYNLSVGKVIFVEKDGLFPPLSVSPSPVTRGLARRMPSEQAPGSCRGSSGQAPPHHPCDSALTHAHCVYSKLVCSSSSSSGIG